MWLYDGKELTPSDKITVSNDGALHRLELHDVRYDDEGNYTCRYKNRRYFVTLINMKKLCLRLYF